jgi:tyrosine-protein kinase Etk/Wzc
MATYTPSVRDTEIDLRTLLSTLGDHKRLILFGTLAFFLLSVLYVCWPRRSTKPTPTVQVERRMPTVPGLDCQRFGSRSLAGRIAGHDRNPVAHLAHACSAKRSTTWISTSGRAFAVPAVRQLHRAPFQSGQPNAVATRGSAWRVTAGAASACRSRAWTCRRTDARPAAALVAGDGQQPTRCYDPKARALVRGNVGQPAQAGGVNMLVRSLQREPGHALRSDAPQQLAILDKLRRTSARPSRAATPASSR